jgi:hypothetical protein
MVSHTSHIQLMLDCVVQPINLADPWVYQTMFHACRAHRQNLHWSWMLRELVSPSSRICYFEWTRTNSIPDKKLIHNKSQRSRPVYQPLTPPVTFRGEHPVQLPVCCRIKKLVRQYSCSINNGDISAYHRERNSRSRYRTALLSKTNLQPWP